MKIKENPNNPRRINKDDFEKLKKSIKDFGDKMMPLRPIIIDENGIILGGNMRYKAIQDLGIEIKEDWVKKASDFTEEEKREFIIKDNGPASGEWDWDMLANEWDVELLNEWGMETPDWMNYKDEDFEPTENDAKLDEKKKIICPKCSHEFET